MKQEKERAKTLADLFTRYKGNPKTFGYPEQESADGAALRQLQLKEFQKIIAKVDSKIPLLCTCGNHDVGNYPSE